MAITMADEYGYWATAQVRKAFAVLKLKRRPTMVKILTVSDNETAAMFTKMFSKAKDTLARKDIACAKVRTYAVLYRQDGAQWSIYLDNTKPAIRRLQRERRRR